MLFATCHRAEYGSHCCPRGQGSSDVLYERICLQHDGRKSAEQRVVRGLICDVPTFHKAANDAKVRPVSEPLVRIAARYARLVCEFCIGESPDWSDIEGVQDAKSVAAAEEFTEPSVIHRSVLASYNP